MRPGSPGIYRCRGRGSDRGMHHWERVPEGARCINCRMVLTGEDGEDVFHGARTPIGQVRVPDSLLRDVPDDA